MTIPNNPFLGNSLVLVGCVKYKAVEVDCVSMVMIEWLAALDLTLSISYMIPVLTTLISERYVLGNLSRKVFDECRRLTVPTTLSFVI